MQQITSNVFVESGLPACNLGLITTHDGIVIIDTPGDPNDALKWRDEIARKGTLRYVINTEEHGDHCSSSWFYPGTLITSLATREKLLKMPQDQARERAKRLAKPEILPLIESFQLRLADITFTDSLNLYLGQHTFKLFALPGHSPGGIAVYIPEEKVVFATDIVFSHYKSWLQEAVPENWLASLAKLTELDIDFVVPGHGAVCTKEYLKEQSNVIENWVSTVKNAIKQGWSVEEAISRIDSPDPYPKQPEITFMTEEQINKACITRLYQLYS